MPTTSPPTRPDTRPWIWALLGFILIAGGLATKNGSGSGTGPTTTTTTSAVTTTTTPGSGYTRPFGDTATWNVPAASFSTISVSPTYTANAYNHLNLNGPGKLSIYFDDYSYPVYDLRNANTTIKVYRTSYGFAGSIANGSSIPWNLSWRTGGVNDNDKIMILLDPSTGKEIDLWNAFVPGDNQSSCITLDNIAAGLDVNAQNLCAGQADVIQDQFGNQSDYRTATHTYPVAGSWMQSQIGLVTADEVASGSIRHALNVIAHNTMFGPPCSPAPSNPVSPGFGSTCGGWVNPASRLEWPDAPQQCGTFTQANTTAGRQETVPEGSRFALTLSDAQIDAWLTSKGYTGTLRTTVRIFAVALRDYGFMVINTSCYDAGIFTDGRLNPATATKWNALGIPTNTTSASRLLDGLITSPSSLRMLTPSLPQVVGLQTVH